MAGNAKHRLSTQQTNRGEIRMALKIEQQRLRVEWLRLEIPRSGLVPIDGQQHASTGAISTGKLDRQYCAVTPIDQDTVGAVPVSVTVVRHPGKL